MNDDFQKEQLHFASADGDLDKVKDLVQKGCDVNAFDELFSFTPLHYAVKENHIDVARYLISVGADVNAYDLERIGETPLGVVAANCSYEIAELLVKAGANPTIPGWMKITALDRAAKRKKEEGKRVYNLLLEVSRKNFNYKA
jgi:ankyrin repeat protein